MKKSRPVITGIPVGKRIHGLRTDHPLIIRYLVLTAVALLSLFLLTLPGYLELNESVSAEDGRLRLPDGVETGREMVSLAGTWHFAWDDFIDDIKLFPGDGYVQVPSSWTKIGRPAAGHASYGLEILFGQSRPRNLSLYIGFVTSAYRLTANGLEIISIGHPERNLKTARFQWYPTVVTISVPEAGPLNLIFHVANAEHSGPGLRAPILIGGPDILLPRIAVLNALSLLLWGILLFITMTYAVISLLRPVEKHFFYFAALAGSFLLNRLFAGTIYLNGFFPGLPWSLLVRMEYLSYPLISFSIFNFIRTLHPSVPGPPRKADIVFKSFITALVLCALFAPLYSVTSFVLLFQASILPALGFAGILAYRMTKSEGSLLPVFRAAVYSILIFGALLSDTLAYNGYNTLGLASFIAIVLFVTHAIRIGINHSKAKMMAENGSRELSAANAALQKLNLSLANSAHRDLVTGLPNRLAMMEFLKGELNRAGRGGEVVAVLFIDLDNFKYVNDNLGHQAGDELLAQVGKRLSRLLRSSDRLFRIGGDEFVVVCPDIANQESIAFIGDRISRALSKTFGIQDREVLIGSSTGIALFPEHGRTSEELLRCADIAMYHVKEFHKGSYAVYQMDPANFSALRMDLGGKLPKALELGNIHLEFQPQIDPLTGRILCVETLARWTEKSGATIPPADFIRTAEETGFIHVLGAWILKEACNEARLFDPAMQIAVNLSPLEICGAKAAGSIEEALHISGFDPKRLIIEITDSALLHDPTTAMANLKAIEALGVRIALDDFGTGYSSLMNLKNLPIAQVKIDRSFIADIPTSLKDQEIVKAVIGLAHGLGIKVCAEGVELAEQQDLLRQFGVDMIQGYLTGRSMPGAEFRVAELTPTK